MLAFLLIYCAAVNRTETTEGSKRYCFHFVAELSRYVGVCEKCDDLQRTRQAKEILHFRILTDSRVTCAETAERIELFFFEGAAYATVGDPKETVLPPYQTCNSGCLFQYFVIDE